MTNWEWLLEMSKERPDELAAWFSATRGGMDAPKEEDGGNDEFPPENVVSVAERARNANKAAQVVPEEHVRDATEMTDSREKLEADVYRAADEMDRFYCGGKFVDTRKIIGWLDRQAAITERYWRKQVDALVAKGDQLAKANAELRDAVEELKAERDDAVEAYDAHMAAHDAWHEAEDIEYTRNRFTVYEQAIKERVARLESERNALAHDLEESEKLRDELRNRLSMALDWAHEIMMLQDLEGEVVA